MFIPFTTLMILAAVIFLLGFISPFLLICYIIMRGKVD